MTMLKNSCKADASGGLLVREFYSLPGSKTTRDEHPLTAPLFPAPLPSLLGTGWVFDRAEANKLREAVGNALYTYRSFRDSFTQVGTACG